VYERINAVVTPTVGKWHDGTFTDVNLNSPFL